MNPHAITFVSNDARRDAGRWLAPMLASWPHAAPRVHTLSLEEAFEGLRDTSAHPPDFGTLLVILGHDIPDVVAYQFADLMHRALLPGVLLHPSPGTGLKALQSGGILVQSAETTPEFLAAALFTLAERQPVVSSLARDVGIAMRQQGGFRGEIDRMHDELNLAASVQQELLPKSLPTLGTLECGVIFRPVGYVSGDIYDVQQLDERHVGFFIADAVGHGVPAALMTMVISRSLGMTRLDEGRRRIVTPAEAMTRLNRELLQGRRQSPRFGTAVYGLLDTWTHRLTICGAGHPPPLVVTVEGSMRTIETDGPLLGVFPDEQYREMSLTLHRGDTLVAYSDGLETAFSPPLNEADASAGHRRQPNLYLERLGQVTWADPDRERGLAPAIEELSAELDRQSGSLHQVDDITILAISASAAPVGMARTVAGAA